MKEITIKATSEVIVKSVTDAMALALVENDGNVNAEACLLVEDIAREIFGDEQMTAFMENVETRIHQMEEEE